MTLTQVDDVYGKTSSQIIDDETIAGGYSSGDLTSAYVIIDYTSTPGTDAPFAVCHNNISIAHYMGSMVGVYHAPSALLCSVGPCALTNGTCGAAHGTPTGSAPSSGLCSTGIESSVSGSGPWTWTCFGSTGGSDINCSAPILGSPVNGSCGSAAGVPSTVTPTTGLCNAGTETGVTLAGNIFSWTCMGISGGTDTPCSAPEMVHGQCGPADGTPTAAAPGGGLCNTGTASALAGTGPWTWNCIGINTGSTQSCTAPLPPPPPTFGGACP